MQYGADINMDRFQLPLIEKDLRVKRFSLLARARWARQISPSPCSKNSPAVQVVRHLGQERMTGKIAPRRAEGFNRVCIAAWDDGV
jgi:hypothetical protein